MRRLRKLGFLVLVLVAWHLFAQAGVWSAHLFPSPLAVAGSLAEEARSGALWLAVGSSLRRVGLGYLISLAIGIPLGVFSARSRWVDDTLGTLVSGLQALPSICWLPLALLWFGLNDRAILFVVVIGSLVSVASAVKDGVGNLPPAYARAARTMGTSTLSMLFRVLIPASLPSVLTAAKLGWAYAWRSLMSGELLFATVGLGRTLMAGRELGDMSRVIGVMLVIVAIGLFTDSVVFGNLESEVRERYGLDTA